MPDAPTQSASSSLLLSPTTISKSQNAFNQLLIETLNSADPSLKSKGSLSYNPHWNSWSSNVTEILPHIQPSFYAPLDYNQRKPHSATNIFNLYHCFVDPNAKTSFTSKLIEKPVPTLPVKASNSTSSATSTSSDSSNSSSNSRSFQSRSNKSKKSKTSRSSKKSNKSTVKKPIKPKMIEICNYSVTDAISPTKILEITKSWVDQVISSSPFFSCASFPTISNGAVVLVNSDSNRIVRIVPALLTPNNHVLIKSENEDSWVWKDLSNSKASISYLRHLESSVLYLPCFQFFNCVNNRREWNLSLANIEFVLRTFSSLIVEDNFGLTLSRLLRNFYISRKRFRVLSEGLFPIPDPESDAKSKKIWANCRIGGDLEGRSWLKLSILQRKFGPIQQFVFRDYLMFQRQRNIKLTFRKIYGIK